MTLTATSVRALLAGLALLPAIPAMAQDTAPAAPATETATETAPARTDLTAETVVATVDGTDITLGDMIALRSALPQQYLALPDDQLFKGILDQLVQQTALAKIGEGELTARDQLLLKTQRLAYVAGIALDKIATAAVTDEAVQAAYDAKYANVEPSTEYNASHILVTTEDEAKAVKAEIDGGKDFAEVAKEKSTGPSGPDGGDLGWFGAGMMVEPFEKAVMAMKPGDVSEPVQTQFGWHIIKLNDTREASAPALDDVRDQLAAEIQEKAVTDEIARVSAAATVERNTDGIDPSVVKDDTILPE
ncbi:peptidylprolyl isomerase [Frigidibacter sp. MR17.24]|uniref:peptidylprolyl isomerase n=1 Tax=Frigidibacter sp. MR17.24 TaxID=3127345 RepID=UPI00301312E3